MAQAKYVNSAICAQTTGASVQSSTTPLWKDDAELITHFLLAGTIRHAADCIARRAG